MNIMVQADKAAFGQGRAEHANVLVDEAGLRIDHGRRRGRGAGMNPSGRFEPVTPLTRRRLTREYPSPHRRA